MLSRPSPQWVQVLGRKVLPPTRRRLSDAVLLKGVRDLPGKSDHVGLRLVEADVDGVSPSQSPRITSSIGVESGSTTPGL